MATEPYLTSWTLDHPSLPMRESIQQMSVSQEESTWVFKRWWYENGAKLEDEARFPSRTSALAKVQDVLDNEVQRGWSLDYASGEDACTILHPGAPSPRELLQLVLHRGGERVTLTMEQVDILRLRVQYEEQPHLDYVEFHEGRQQCNEGLHEQLSTLRDVGWIEQTPATFDSLYPIKVWSRGGVAPAFL